MDGEGGSYKTHEGTLLPQQMSLDTRPPAPLSLLGLLGPVELPRMDIRSGIAMSAPVNLKHPERWYGGYVGGTEKFADMFCSCHFLASAEGERSKRLTFPRSQGPRRREGLNSDIHLSRR